MSSPLEFQARLSDVPVPGWVTDLARGRSVEPVWRNEEGGLTFRFGDGHSYLKVQRPSVDWVSEEETARLAWVARFVPSPTVLASGRHGDEEWLLTAGLPGRSAVDHRWRNRPGQVVPVLGRALRRFHDTVPSDCPFSWSVEYRVRRYALDRAFLDHLPALDPVTCHGDACNPNFLLTDDGAFSGYVDLGGLGVADRWADLAPALQSLTWNYGDGWQSAFLDGYGIPTDEAKLAYYTALWDGVGEGLGRSGLG